MIVIYTLFQRFQVLVRTFFYSFLLSVSPRYLRVYGSISLKNIKNIKCSKNLRLNDYVYINGMGGVEIGENVTLSVGVRVISAGVKPELVKAERSSDYHYKKKVCIGSNIWFGANSIILPGVELTGTNVIVAAGAVVSKSFSESNVVLAGVPAKVIKSI